jgi:hypothetical protein
LFCLALPALCAAQTAGADATSYLNRALDEMQARSLRRNQIDWPRLRRETLARAEHAELTVDTYDAIRFALARLEDGHSSFHPTPALEKLEAERKAKRPQPPPSPEPESPPSSPFVGRNEPEGRLVTIDGKTFPLVVVSKCFVENERQFVAYASQLQRIIAELHREHPTGWIVDLRGNVGGNMWPMLAGIGPLVGESDRLGGFLTLDSRSDWSYRKGVAAEIENGKRNAYPAVAGAPYKLAAAPRIAVLIDRRTGSSGEAVAIAFRGRPDTRFFGEHTEGESTANRDIALSDGAVIWLTVGVDTDRTGRQYLNGFDPDEMVPGGEQILPDDQDPAVQAAFRWLSRPDSRSHK